MPVLLHTWGMKLAAPDKCAEVARRWPNIKLILGHTGGTTDARLKCEKVARDPANSNLYFDFCGSFMADRSWEDTLQHIDYRRIFYGTDSFLHEISWELGRLLSSDIPDEQLIAIRKACNILHRTDMTEGILHLTAFLTGSSCNFQINDRFHGIIV